jgi:hypothetical protein
MDKYIIDINVIKLIEKYTQHRVEEIIDILLNATKTTIYCDVDKQKRINIWLSYVHILTKNKLIKFSYHSHSKVTKCTVKLNDKIRTKYKKDMQNLLNNKYVNHCECSKCKKYINNENIYFELYGNVERAEINSLNICDLLQEYDIKEYYIFMLNQIDMYYTFIDQPTFHSEIRNIIPKEVETVKTYLRRGKDRVCFSVNVGGCIN